jgi:hypothetical protein
VGLAVLLGAGNATAQTISLNGNSDETWRATQLGAHAGQHLDLGAVSVGDNRSDLIVGAPGSPTVPGAVYVLFGGPVRPGERSLAAADTVITGTAGDSFGFSTAAGNVITPQTSLTRNLIVGAPDALGGRGAVYVFLGGFASGAHLTTANAVFTIVGQPGDHLGSALATADLNNDNFREIIIGATGHDLVYVVNGASTLSGTRDLAVTPANLTIQANGAGDVLAAGDVTGDGLSDLLVGSSDLNVVYLYKGQNGSLPLTPSAAFNGVHVGDRAGTSIRLLDIDHDGIRDVMIGAPGADGPTNTRTDSGAVYLLWGSATLGSKVLSESDVTFFGATPNTQLGTQISAGDVNRDFPADIVMLGPGAAAGAGELDIYYGRTDRTAYGVNVGNGHRVVDFADPAQADRKILGEAAFGQIVSTEVFELTGEGARDVIASVPSQDGGIGAVYFTTSPSIILSSVNVSVVVNKNATASSAPINITNRSIIGVTWAAAGDQPWLTAAPTSGTTAAGTPGSVAALVNATGLTAGTHVATFNIRSTSKHLEMTIPVSVTTLVTDTRVAIDSPAEGSTVSQPFTMSGWSIDIGAPTGTGVDAVHVYAFRNDGSGAAPTFVGASTYGASRPDVGGIFGPQFTPSGFSLQVAGLAPGPYKLVAFGHNKATGTFTATAERLVTISATGMLFIDAPGPGATVTSAFEVGGWAIDPAATTGSGIDGVQFYIFPNDGAAPGVFVGAGSYGWARPDVAAILGPRFANCGYHFTVTGAAPGNYLLAVYAHSTVTNSYSVVKTEHIVVNANALMSIDIPSAESTITTPTFDVSGWALDRAAASGIGVDTLHVYAYHNPHLATNEPPVFLGVATLGIARNDVGAAFGARFTNSGYEFNVNSAAAGFIHGDVYNIVVWAHSTATGTFNNVAVVRVRIQ